MSRATRKGRHRGDDHPIVARVPVIPMLDMAFQLLAFGLYCFDLTADKIEGQLSLSLPKTGADAETPIQTPTITEPEEDFTIRVSADGAGRIASIELTTTKVTTPEALPRDIVPLANTLKEKVEKKTSAKEKAPKLEMQFDKKLNYQLCFELLSAADTAKFSKVTPNILGAEPKKPPPGMP
jgi:biopolymer transport protein ExbD